MKKKMRDCFASLAMTSGISAVPLIIALVLLITLGAFFISLMLGKHIGAPLLAQSTKALYIADAGIEYTTNYLRGIPNWTTVPDNIIPPISFGGGTFAVAFTNKTQNSVIATSTGTIGNAIRVISINFERKSLLELNPVNWVSEIRIRENVTVPPNPSPCPQCDVTSPDTCLPCTNLATLGQAPTLNPPPGVTGSDLDISGVTCTVGGTPPSLTVTGNCTIAPGTTYLNVSRLTISGNHTFSGGTYFFDRLEIQNNANVSVLGPVTIWILDRFKMNSSSQFNWGGSASNLLLLSAGGPEDAAPDFEIENGAMFRGAIYSPNPEADVEIEDAQIAGAIVGNEVELRDTIVTHDPTAGLNAPGYEQTRVVVKASGWGEM